MLLDSYTEIDIVLNPYYLATLGLMTWWSGWRWGLAATIISIAYTFTFETNGSTVSLINASNWAFTRVAVVTVASYLWRSARRNQDLSRTDQITGLANRRFFEEAVSSEVTRAWRYQHPMCVALLDVNKFKNVNDMHGHAAGDNLLRQIGMALQSSVRSTDIVARVGGDEFAILFIETTKPAAEAALEHALEEVQRIHTPGITSGVTEYHPLPPTISALLERGDKDMYNNKKFDTNWSQKGC